MLSGDNSILQKATDAKQTSERAEAKEQAQMDIMAYIADKTANHQDASLDNAKIKEILSDNKSYVKTANDTSFTTAKGEYEIPYSELYTASDITSTTTLPAGTYSVGQEVIFGEESFFVIADDGDSVRLLAKYCLNQEGSAQTDKNSTNVEYGRNFSNNMYWSSSTNYYECEDYTDLQTSTMIEKAQQDGTIIQSAVLTAIAYGEEKGVTGRLMTYDEASAMITSSSAMMYGKWTDGTQPTQGYLNWWIGTGCKIEKYDEGTPSVYAVDGQWILFAGTGFNSPYHGVRPVLVVPES